MTGGVLAPTLPEALTTAARALHDFADPVAMRRRVAVLSLRRWTAGGFEPVPPATAPRALSDADRLRGDPQAPVLWAPDPDSGTLCAANGHETRTRLAPDEVRRLTRALSGPDPVAVGALLNAVAPGARRDVGRALLERLESFRVFHRTP